MHVEFAEVRKIPIASVLKFYKVYARKRSDTELVADCPFPSHKTTEHANKNPTLAISTEKNRWYCHSDSCRAASNKPKGGDAIDVVAMMENLTPLDAAKKLAEMFCVGTTRKEKPMDGEMTREVLDALVGPNAPLAFELRGIAHENPFIQGRGITKETAQTFGVGFFSGKGSMAGRVVFPLNRATAFWSDMPDARLNRFRKRTRSGDCRKGCNGHSSTGWNDATRPNP